MKPARFRYHDPETLEQACALLAEVGDDSALLAGGQSLVPMMNLRLAQPAHVIDLNRVGGLAYIRRTSGALAIGAMTRHAALESSAEVGRMVPLLAQVVPHIGYPPIRARGTVGGSLAHADPSAELACASVALGATVVLASARGRREVEAASFFKGPFSTDRASDEIVAEVRFPATGSAQSVFLEFARKLGDFALALVAVVLYLDGPTCRSARIALGGVAPAPFRARRAEAVLEGSHLDEATIREAAGLARAEANPVTDIHGSAEYRRRIVEVMSRRALEMASGAPR